MKCLPVLALGALSLAACGSGSGNERDADKITRAVIANDVRPVMAYFDPGIKGELTRVRIAELSDELSVQGAYLGLKQTNQAWCDRPGYLCFDVHFEKRSYHEVMKRGADGKVKYWWIQAAREHS